LKYTTITSSYLSKFTIKLIHHRFASEVDETQLGFCCVRKHRKYFTFDRGPVMFCTSTSITAIGAAESQ